MRRLLVLAAALAFVSTPDAGAAVYFDFHRITNTGSVLYETWQDAATGKVYAQQSWRAGSGVGTDECASGVGWLPAGYYNLVAHYDHYDGSKIKGRVWQLSDKACRNGTTIRTELFIHSEETADQGQYCTSYYDDPFCWEGDFDYKSAGCIKVAHATPYPSAVAQVDNAWHNWGGGSGYLNLYRRVYVYGP